MKRVHDACSVCRWSRARNGFWTHTRAKWEQKELEKLFNGRNRKCIECQPNDIFHIERSLFHFFQMPPATMHVHDFCDYKTRAQINVCSATSFTLTALDAERGARSSLFRVSAFSPNCRLHHAFKRRVFFITHRWFHFFRFINSCSVSSLHFVSGVRCPPTASFFLLYIHIFKCIFL